MAESSTVCSPGILKSGNDLAALIRAARQDPREFGGLYSLYVRPVFRYLYSRIGSIHDAEDVTAQTFLAAFQAFDQFRQDDHFAAWLFSIARNKAMDYFRKQKSQASLDDAEELPGKDDPLGEVIRSEQAALLARLIAALPEEERELLRLRYLAEMSFAEIAHLLHRNEDTVKKSIYRLLARLQSQAEGSNVR